MGYKAIRESEIERFFYQGVRKLGGECLKWESTHKAGLPDRIVLFNGKLYLVELKRDRGIGKLSQAQIDLFKRFEKQGFKVNVLYGMEETKEFLTMLEREEKGIEAP